MLWQLQAALIALAHRHPELPAVVVNDGFESGPAGWGTTRTGSIGHRASVVIVDDVSAETSTKLAAGVIHHLKAMEAPEPIYCTDDRRRSKGDKKRAKRYGERWT